MKALIILRQKPQIFFRLSGIGRGDFDDLSAKARPLWEKHRQKRLLRKGRKRAVGGGRKPDLDFEEQLLMCLIYYRTYISHEFLGLLFGVSDSTSIRVVNSMTEVLAKHFRMPERKVRLSEEEKAELVYLMVDGTERPVQRPQKPGTRKKSYSGKKKRHTAVHQIVTDDKKRILAVGPAQDGRKHDKKIYDESRLEKPPDVLGLGDLGYQGTMLEIPIKKPKKKELSKEDKKYNKWFSRLRIGVEHAIGRMKKFGVFAGIHRGNRLQNMMAKNVGALANMNLKIA
jgi:hypothetical protein